MSKALRNVNVHQTVQTSKAKPNQVKNNAGGFVFKISDLARLERFLIIGTDGGTYYVKEQKLTEANVTFLTEFLRKDTKTVIDTVVEVSESGRAVRNSPAIFTLALAMNVVDESMKPYVRQAVNKVCRTGTHLFEFNQYVENLGGWGRAKRKAVAEWYSSKRPVNLAYQAIKYRQRNGWTHRDSLRISHAKLGPEYAGTVNWILGKDGWNASNVPSIILGFEHAQAATSIDELVSIVKEYNLPWEAVPTQFHKEPKLWRALFEADSLGQTALLRNVTRLAKLEMFNDMKFTADYAQRLADPERIAKGKLHPIQYLNAAVVFDEGQIDRSYGFWSAYRNKNWESNSKISQALDSGFYSAFKNVEPANKRTLIGLDISGSMATAANGLELSCAQVSGAIAMMVARTEPYSMVRGFSTQFIDLGINESMSLPQVMKTIQGRNFGGTDCSLPMEWAIKNNVEVDTFVVITDNETYAGDRHPFQALKDYRKKSGIDARLAVLGVAATKFTIADPSDAGMMDFVGFDSSGPKLLTEFSAGRI